VGLLPLGLQSKLLKVIEERTVRRLGSTRSEPLDVAIVAATSEDLAAATKEGRFRLDLYHRLAVVTLVLPPLRARGRDVVVLAEEFLARVCEDYGLPPRALTEDALAALQAYPWPGNVRELANVLERAALLSDEPKLTSDRLGLPTVAAPAAGLDWEGERAALLDVLQGNGWNFTRAAAQLGVPRNTLRYRAERLGLAPEATAERRRGGRPSTARAIPPSEPRATEPATPQTRRVTLLLTRRAAGAPAGWQASRILEDSTEKIRSFGGRVQEIRPDGLLAVFGLEPDEEAPRHATYAALAVQALAARTDAAEGPRLTVGLHTELLPVSGDGTAARVDPRASAEAARVLDALLEAALPGSVVATAAASRFLARRFELAPLGDAKRGACRVVRNAEPGRARFVGRERELALLQQCFELAQGGRGQVVMIVGEPGIGKSRLLHEFRRRLGRSATWVEGHALSFGRTMPFHPVIDMIRRVCRIDDADSEAVIVDKLERAASRLGDDMSETLVFLRYLLSVDPGDPAVAAMDPRQRHAAIVEATHRLVERGSELRPHVFVLEDLHWGDPATEDWVTRLADRIVAKRVLIIMTYRPGYRPESRGFHTALALSTLSNADSLEVARSLLEVEELPAPLQELVLDKAEGNPFFIEELVRSLQERGVLRRDGERVELAAPLDRVTVPDTVEDVILDRVHRLDDQLGRVLDVASVIGKNVPFPLLRAVTGRDEAALGADLHRLQAAGFVNQTRAFPEVEYTFKHALTQDVAYARVPNDVRRVLHARIVEAIEALYRDRLDEHVERLAYHAARGEHWAQAVRYARQAGAKAFDRSANREAVASFDDALAALARMPESPATLAAAIDIRLAARSALLQLAELRRVERTLREAETLASALGDRRRLAWVWIFMTTAHLFAGEPGEALAVGERALAQAEAIGDLGLRATARTPLAHACCERGDYRRATELCDEAIAALTGDHMGERMGQAVPPSLYARCIAAISRAELGEFAEAERLATEAAATTRALDLPFGFALARIALGHCAIVRGRIEDAHRALESAREVIEMRGLPTWYPWAAALHGYALALGGSVDDGIGLLERALERAVKLPFLFGHAQWVAWLAHAHVLAGRPDEAHHRGDEALRFSRQRGARGHEAWALYVRGEVEAMAGNAGAATAEAFARQAHTLAEMLGMRPVAERCLALLGRLRLGREAGPSRASSA
jgi:tetratricopeptide (TPR) repeat protein